jgi:glycosyltransferase involved in cell wall biosynthesis
MATFDGEAYLEQQLVDLSRQSLLPSELVVCDDGSTDETLTILERFAREAPFPVRIHRNCKRLGYRANFVKCAGLCRAELIAFCDQDDRWSSEKIERMSQCFEDEDVLLAFHDAETVSADGSIGSLTSMPRPPGVSPPLSGSPWTFALGFSQMFRRWLCDFDQWWPQSLDHLAPEPLAHDQWYFFLASTLGSIVHVQDPLVQYRQHHGNVFGWRKRSWGFRLLDRLRSSTSSVARRANAAAQRATILDVASQTLPQPYRQRAVEGALFYRRFADLSEQRAAMHLRPTFIDRVRCFGAFVSANGYGAKPWQFGVDALALDLLIALPLGPGRRRVKGEPLESSRRGGLPG